MKRIIYQINLLAAFILPVNALPGNSPVPARENMAAGVYPEVLNKPGKTTATIGTIYSKNSWTSTADFITNGNSTAVLNGSYVNISAASTYNWANSIYITNYQTRLEKWQFKAKFKILAWAANSYGIGFGVKSANAVVKNDVFGFVQTTHTGTGTLYIVKGDQTVLNTSSLPLGVSLNDVIEITARFDINQFDFTAVNITSGNSRTVSFTYASNGSTAVVPNSGYFSLLELGGTHQIQNIDISSDEVTGASIVTLGDSKTIGYFASSFAGRYAAQLNNNYPPAIITAGGGDRVIHALARQTELERLAPQKYLLCIGSNDLRFGGTLSELQTNYAALVSFLQATGAVVFHILIPEDYTKTGAVNQVAFRDWMAATYGSFYINAVWDSLSTGNVLKGIYDTGDGVHLNQPANDKIYEALVASGQLANTTLPVKLYSFSARLSGSQARLSWETDPVDQASSYELMKSKDGTVYQTLETIPANITGRYLFNDHHLYRGMNYYRLKMKEADGSYTYSRVVAVVNKNGGPEIRGFSIHPDALHIDVVGSGHSKAYWEVFDALGRKVLSEQAVLNFGNNRLKVPTWRLSRGLHHFKLHAEGEIQVGSFSFIK